MLTFPIFSKGNVDGFTTLKLFDGLGKIKSLYVEKYIPDDHISLIDLYKRHQLYCLLSYQGWTHRQNLSQPSPISDQVQCVFLHLSEVLEVEAHVKEGPNVVHLDQHLHNVLQQPHADKDRNIISMQGRIFVTQISLKFSSYQPESIGVNIFVIVIICRFVSKLLILILSFVFQHIIIEWALKAGLLNFVNLQIIVMIDCLEDFTLSFS